MLQGPEVQLVQPSDTELAAAAAAAGSSAASEWSGMAAAGQAGSAGNGTAAAAAAGDLDHKGPTVFVFEGQTLSWTLTLTNISDQPITGCKVLMRFERWLLHSGGVLDEAEQ